MRARFLRVALVASWTVSTLCAGYTIAFSVEWKVNDPAATASIPKNIDITVAGSAGADGGASVKIRKLETMLIQQGDATASGGSFTGTMSAPGGPGMPWPTGSLQFYGQVYYMGLHKDDGELFSIVNP